MEIAIGSEMEYQKIPGPFKRDPVIKKILTGVWTSPELEILAPLNEWLFTEKIDGTNVRIFWNGHRVSWRGRTDNAQFSVPMIEALERLVGGADNETLFEQKFGGQPAVLYGELYGPKIQKGGIYRDDIDFLMFDARIAGLWLLREDVEDIASSLGLGVVPLVSVEDGPLSNPASLLDGIEFVKEGMLSLTGFRNGKPFVYAEGLVAFTQTGFLDRRGKRIIVKLKHVDLYEE